MTTLTYNTSNNQWQDATGVQGFVDTDTFVDGSPYVAVGTTGAYYGRAWIVAKIEKGQCLVLWFESAQPGDSAHPVTDDWWPLGAVQHLRCNNS